MTQAAEGITAIQALAYANDLGVDVSPTQFERWRKYGLLPRPVDRPGEGRGKGRKGRYHPAVVPLLGAISSTMSTEGRLDRAAWSLWVLGLPVTRAARRAIDEYLAQQEAKAKRRLGTQHGGAGVKPGTEPIDSLEYARLPKGMWRIRRRLGKPTFARAVRLLNEMLLGEFRSAPPRDHPDFKLVMRALAGLTRSQGTSAPEPLLSDDLAVLLSTVSKRANLHRVRQRVAKSSDWLLEGVRDEARAMLRVACARSGQPEIPLTMPLFLLWVGALLSSPRLSNVVIDLELAGDERWQALKRSPLEKMVLERPELRALLTVNSANTPKQGATP